LTNIFISARRGAGAPAEILYGTVTFKPTLAHSRSTSIVLPAPTTFDLVDGEVVATNVQPTPDPVAGQIEWAYEVTFKDRHSKTYSFLVGVPDSTTQVNFTSLPRYFETKPPLFGQGPKGEPGEAATVAVGTVTGGTTAAVTNTGTNSDAVLNFVLPKGDKGDTGAGVPAGGTSLQYIRKNSGNTGTEWATLSKASVGLSNVDNTSDANKPVSTAQASAIALSDTLPYRSKTVTAAPSEYPEGVTVFVGTSADGWPGAPGGVPDSVRVVTFRALSDQNVIQYLSARLPTSGIGLNNSGILYRTSNSAGLWGDFQELGRGKNGGYVFNVKDYGAVGDGITDDTPAIQATFDIVASVGGGTVLIPPGDYWPRTPILLPRNVGFNIVGQGWPILRRKNGDPFYAMFAGRSEGNRGYGSGASNFTCTGIEFRGSFKIGADRSLGAFALHHSQNVEVYNNRFIECHSKGHVFDLNGCDNVLIRDNVFKGMWRDNGDGIAEAIQFDQSKNGSLSYGDLPGSYDGLMSRNITIQHNKFLPYYDADGVWYPASNIGGNHTTRQGAYYENIKILDNYVEDPIQTTITAFRGNIHLQGSKSVEIRNNKWVSTKGGNTKLISILTVDVGNDLSNDPEVVTPVGPIPPQGCIDVTIEGNEFIGFNGTSDSEYMVHVWGKPDYESVLTGVSIRNNKYLDNVAGSTASDPVRVQYAQGVKVEGQQFAGKNSRVLYAVGVQGLDVISNSSDWAEVIPLWLENCSSVTVQGNRWANYLGNPRAKGCTDLLVIGNLTSTPRASNIGFVVESSTRFRVGQNSFTSVVGGSAGVALSGSANTAGTIDGNNFYGYSTAVQGTGSGVTIGTNPN
jgi:hypothetical protein